MGLTQKSKELEEMKEDLHDEDVQSQGSISNTLSSDDNEADDKVDIKTHLNKMMPPTMSKSSK